MRFQNTIIVVAATLLAAPSLAVAAPAEGGGAKASERKICRHIDATGTRLTKKACHTRAEWKKIEKLP